MSTFNLFKKDRFSIFLYLLLAFHTVSFVVFQLLNKAYERWDSAGHLGMSFWIADRFKALLSGNLNLIEILLREQNDNLPLNKLMQNSKLEIQQIKKLLENLESAEE